MTYADAGTLKGGYVYNTGDVLNLVNFADGNLLTPLGDGEEQGFTFGDGSGFTAPLPAELRRPRCARAGRSRMSR